MPDSTAEIETRIMCADVLSTFEVPSDTLNNLSYIVSFHGTEALPECACPSYYYAPADNKSCKHIGYVIEHGCFYNTYTNHHGERNLETVGIRKLRTDTTSTTPGETCPVCKGPVIVVRYAV